MREDPGMARAAKGKEKWEARKERLAKDAAAADPIAGLTEAVARIESEIGKIQKHLGMKGK
jgi:hypothetical protein